MLPVFEERFGKSSLFATDGCSSSAFTFWLVIAKSPGMIPALLRPQRNCRFAAQRLANTLVQVI